MKYCYDTEFLEDGKTIELISIGIVAEDGREYYAVRSDAPWERIETHRWLMENVVPHLPLTRRLPVSWADNEPPSVPLDYGSTTVKPKWVIANEVRDFLLATDTKIELWADYGAYDHVVLMQLWGPMIKKPSRALPMWTHDLMQLAESLGVSEDDFPEGENVDLKPHHALDDAIANARLRNWLVQQVQNNPGAK